MSTGSRVRVPGCSQVSDSSALTNDSSIQRCELARLDAVLRLELLLKEPQLDLDRIVKTVVSDPQLQSWLNDLTRAAFEDPRSAPTRIADCVIEMGRDHLIASLSKVPLLRPE